MTLLMRALMAAGRIPHSAPQTAGVEPAISRVGALPIELRLRSHPLLPSRRPFTPDQPAHTHERSRNRFRADPALITPQPPRRF